MWAVAGMGERARRRLCAAALLASSLALVSGCVGGSDLRASVGSSHTGGPLIAVFPVESLAGKPTPIDDVRRLLIERLERAGLRVLDDAALERTFTKHRVRYTAGVDPVLATTLRQETGVAGIVIPTVELYDATTPPRVALFARLVTTASPMRVAWIDGRGAAGDDSPGLLGIGLVDDARELLRREVDVLVASLARHLVDTGERLPVATGPKKFRPKLIYRADTLDPGRTYSIAVVPFFNKSGRKYAGDIVALHMMAQLAAFQNLSVAEPGMVREELLRFRIIMNDGISLADTDLILNAVEADLVLNGEVLEYQDATGGYGAPKVDFSVLFIERKTRRVVYSSYSDNAGDDRVYFFDWGRVNTAHAMAAYMARAIGERMPAAPPTTAGLKREKQ